MINFTDEDRAEYAKHAKTVLRAAAIMAYEEISRSGSAHGSACDYFTRKCSPGTVLYLIDELEKCHANHS